MKRRNLIPLICVAGIAASIPLSASAKVGNSNPNIVVILADDMGYGDAGCYNVNSKIPTPHLDQMAGEGMRFTDAHSPSAVCSPTRYGLLTGRYAWRTEMKKGVLGAWDRPLIEKDRLTLASMLKLHDYHSACIGKWHLGWEWTTADGTPLKISRGAKHEERVKLAEAVDYTQTLGGGAPGAGFDFYHGDGAVNQPPYLWIENNRCMTQPMEPLLESIRHGSSNGPATPGWDQTQVLPRMTEKALQYIHERGKEDKPFFLYLALSAPHVPVMPNKPYRGKSVYGAYGDFVHQCDDIVGQISDALTQNGFAENTLVIFTSDNGSFAPTKKGHAPNGALRGKKGRIFEGGHRVPFLVRWPGTIKGGSVNHQLVGVNDVMATAAAIVGHELPVDAAEDSANLLPTLLNASTSVRQDLVHHSRSGEFAIRDGDWKLITDTKRKPVLLFNIGNDLAEKNNLYDQHPEVVKRLADKLEMQCQSGWSVQSYKKTNQHRGSRKKKAGTSVETPAYAASVPKSTLSDVPYGKHERHVLDFWKAESDKPTPLVFVIHGGGWKGGSKERLNRFVDADALLNAGISVVAINYRLMRHAEDVEPPVKAPLHDAARALQFVRSKADEWNIDKTRIGAAGSSAGACSSLWLLYHDDLTDPKSKDPIARESTRLHCAAVNNAQTTLDPQQMKEWTPNSKYGGHAFGINGFDQFLTEREKILPWIQAYSPYALASSDDPPVYLSYKAPPSIGNMQKDPTHTANFGVKLQQRCVELDLHCELVYPRAAHVRYQNSTDYLIATLKHNDRQETK